MSALVAASAQAHDILGDGGQTADAPKDPSDGLSSGDDPPGDGDPVYLHSGEFYITASELTTPEPVIPTRGPMIDLRRCFHGGYAYNGAMGVGWDFGLNRRLRQLDNGDILISSGLCRTDVYSFDGSGWQAPSGVVSTLAQLSDGSFAQTSRDGTVHEFDSGGRLLSVRDRHGNALTLVWSEDRHPIFGLTEFFVDTTPRIVSLEYRLERISDPAGREIEFEYAPTTGRIARISDWTGRAWSYDYDENGNLSNVTGPGIAGFPNGTTTSYRYDDPRFPHKLTRIIPPTGQASGTASVETVLDGEGRVLSQVLGGDPSRQVQFSYFPEEGRTEIVDPNGTRRIHTFADRLRTGLAVETRGVRPAPLEPVGTQYAVQLEYSADRRVIRRTYPEGNGVEYVYDESNPDPRARANLIQIRQFPKPASEEPVRVLSITYKTPYQQVGTITDTLGNVTEYFYDESDNLERIVYPPEPEGTPSELFTYNSAGQLERAVDANGVATRYEYDAVGYLYRVTRADGTVEAAETTFSPDSLGRPTEIRDPLGLSTSLTFNAWNLLDEIVAPAPLGYVTSFAYDAGGNRVRIEQQSEVAGDPKTTTLTYSVDGRLRTVTNEMGESWRYSYDPNGNLIEVLDPANNPTRFVFDERNLPYQREDANGSLVTLVYHPNGTPSMSVDQRGNETTFSYDGFDRITRTTFPNGGSEERVYDSGSRLVGWKTRGDELITFSYDARGRVRSRTTQTETNTYSYDLGGRITSASNQAAAISYVYDLLDRPVSELTEFPGWAPLEVAFEYDFAGNRTRIVYPDGEAYRYEYDEKSRLRFLKSNEGSAIGSYSHDEVSRLRDRALSSGASSSRQYDRVGRLVGLSFARGVTALETLAFAYDASGSLSSTSDGLGVHGFTYDAAKQLLSADYDPAAPFDDLAVTYDSTGNRVSTQRGLTTAPYVVNELNQYVSVDGALRSYDAHGNLVSDMSRIYSFDVENQLRTIDVPASSVTADYEYDPFGRRVRKVVNGQATRFLWAEDQVVAELDEAGGITARYLHDGQLVAAHICVPTGGSGEAVFDIHRGRLQEPRIVTDEAGVVVWAAHYDAFGNVEEDSDPDGDGVPFELNLRFPGHYFDRESGLHYNRFRYYDPDTGRYLSPDPLGITRSVNLYTYAGNDPLRWLDFFGLASPGDVVFFNWSARGRSDYPRHAAVVTAVDADGNPTEAFGAWGDTMTFHNVDLSEYNGGITDNIVGTGDMSGLSQKTTDQLLADMGGDPVAPGWDGTQGQVCIDAITSNDGAGGQPLREAMADDYEDNPDSYRDYGNGKPSPSDPNFYRRNPNLQQFFRNSGRYTSTR